MLNYDSVIDTDILYSSEYGIFMILECTYIRQYPINSPPYKIFKIKFVDERTVATHNITVSDLFYPYNGSHNKGSYSAHIILDNDDRRYGQLYISFHNT